MELNWLDRIGDWNPQLLRELKGRLKPRNLIIAVATSLVGQLLLLMTYAERLPVDRITGEMHNKYCTGSAAQPYNPPLCLQDSLGSFDINWQLWSLDVFISLSIIGILALLAIGTYMLIGDLSREEHRGTLNFIRLSPQSTQSVLTGKLLGTPILLYIAGAFALPLHLWLGQTAQIPLSLIFSFYGVLAASCLFFYSASLLYGLVSGGLGGFQAWLGSGGVLMFLISMTGMTSSNREIVTKTLGDWLMLFSPSFLLQYLVASSSLPLDYFNAEDLGKLQVFGVSVGGSVWIALGFMLLNYGLWSYWVWQGLNRCFHNPSATVLSKRQSYLLTACLEVEILGFSLQPVAWSRNEEGLFANFAMLLVFNLVLFLVLIAALSPHRQALQDWARYRHQNQSSRQGGIVADLLWGEKSPALVAVALNLAIAVAILTPWVLLWSASEYKRAALLGLVLSVNLILIYALAAQLMLLMKTAKRGLWAASTVCGLIALPPIVFGLLSINPNEIPALWLFSAFGWAAVKDAATSTVFLAVLGQWLGLTLLTVQMTRQLRVAGESATKALFAGRPSLPSA